MFYFVFLFVLSSTFAQLPSIKGALNEPTFSILKDVALKSFNKHSTDIHLEDFEEDIVVATVTAKNITMSIKPIANTSLGIELSEGTNEFIIKGTNLSMNGSLNLAIKIAFIKIQSHGEMGANGLNFSARARIFKNGTRLAVNVTDVKIGLTKDNISIKLSGNIISSILNALVAFLKTFFFDNIRNACQAFFPEIISNATNTILSTLPDEVPITKGASVKFLFVEPPKIHKGYAIAPILTYVHKDSDKKPPPYNPPPIPDLDENCHKGIQIFISDYIIRTAVETADGIGLLSYNKTLDLLGFKTEVQCGANSTPIIKFDGNINFTGNAICRAKVFISRDFSVKLDLLLTLNAGLHEIIKNSTLYLNVQQLLIKDLKIIIGNIFDLKELIKELNKYIGVVIEYLNIVLSDKGIPLPSIAHFDISDINEGIQGHNIAICGNLKPKEKAFKFNFASDYYYSPKSSSYSQITID